MILDCEIIVQKINKRPENPHNLAAIQPRYLRHVTTLLGSVFAD